MTWTKIDSASPDDPRLLRLPRGIRWMHVEGLVWCNQQGTDGHIPEYAIRRVTDEEDPVGAAGQLVATGLWETAEDGWTIVDFLNDQLSAAEVERRQVLARDRQRRQRQHRNGDHSLCNRAYCRQAASRVTDGDTDSVTHDTRTVPSVPTRTEGTEGRGGEEGRADSDSSGGSAPLAPHSPSPANGVPAWMAGPPPGVTPTVNGVPVGQATP